MADLHAVEFVNYVKEWIVANNANIGYFWPQKGGWEGCAQAMITGFLLSKNSTYSILREQHVYTSGKKAADFLLNNNSAPGERVIVELKCQSFENYGNFKDGILKDALKLKDEVKLAYQAATFLAMGIYFIQLPAYPADWNYEVVTGEVGICWQLTL